MRSTWPALVAVVAVGTVIGISIGGLPSSRASETVTLPSTTAAAPMTAPLDTTPLRTSTTALPVTVATTTPPATAAPTTVAPSTTAAPTTLAPTTTEPATTPTTTPTTTPAPTALLDRAGVRIVLANGDGRYNLVGANVDRLLPLGYVTIDQTDVPESRRVARTTIFHRDGFDDEARRLAEDLLVPGALVEPLADRTITADDANGDLIAVLGPDAVR